MGKKIQYSFQRYEKKYLITPLQQKRICAAARDYMKEDAYGRYTICNIYYDTPDWSLIRASLEKPVYKEKLRVRSYGTPALHDNVFVEIKKKYDGVVYKRRAVMEAGLAEDYLAGGAPASPGGQIGREIDWFQRFYRTAPQVFIGYERMALAGIEDPELRITFDTNLRWRDTGLDLCLGDHGERLLPGDQILMEIKIPGAAPFWLSRMLSEVQAFPISFSKYGTCYQNFIQKETIFSKEMRCSA